MLNWLALAGWGVQHENGHPSPSRTPSTQPPDSTALMTLPELIEQVASSLLHGVLYNSSITLPIPQFDLSSLTHRRNILDPAKLAYLNKHHLLRSWQSEQGIAFQAKRVHDVVKAAFPHRCVRSIYQVPYMLTERFLVYTRLWSMSRM